MTAKVEGAARNAPHWSLFTFYSINNHNEARDGMTTAEITLHHLTVRKHQENGSIFVKAGDEPYFVVIGFRTTVGAQGSTSVWTNKYTNDKWANNIKKPKTKAIPPSMGAIVFPDMRAISNAEFESGVLPELAGTVTIAFESDATSWSTVERFVKKAKSALERELVRVVESIGPNSIPNKETLQQSVERLKGALKPNVLDAITVMIDSFGDVDDYLGVYATVLVGVGPDLSAYIKPIANDQMTLATLASLPPTQTIKFYKDGAKYDVTMSISLR